MRDKEGQLLPAGFPPADIPTVYADGIYNISHGPQVCKMYLYRADPRMQADGEHDPLFQPILQVVMPVTGFLQASVFIQELLPEMLSHPGVAETLEEIRENWSSERALSGRGPT
jgi:hypothetical protein